MISVIRSVKSLKKFKVEPWCNSNRDQYDVMSVATTHQDGYVTRMHDSYCEKRWATRIGLILRKDMLWPRLRIKKLTANQCSESFRSLPNKDSLEMMLLSKLRAEEPISPPRERCGNQV